MIERRCVSWIQKNFRQLVVAVQQNRLAANRFLKLARIFNIELSCPCKRPCVGNLGYGCVYKPFYKAFIETLPSYELKIIKAHRAGW